MQGWTTLRRIDDGSAEQIFCGSLQHVCVSECEQGAFGLFVKVLAGRVDTPSCSSQDRLSGTGRGDVAKTGLTHSPCVCGQVCIHVMASVTELTRGISGIGARRQVAPALHSQHTNARLKPVPHMGMRRV